MKYRVLVTDRIAEEGLAVLSDAGHNVDVQVGLSSQELLAEVRGADALIIRSATRVIAEVFEAGKSLKVVGRAGAGVDNIDLAAADACGVTVVNTPRANSLSAAEHTMALLLAMARNVPQAHSALREGRWERSLWQGVELSGKTLGIVGFGQIGRLVGERAAAFGMKLLAYDPYVSEGDAANHGAEKVELSELMAKSDFITLHAVKTPETIGLISGELMSSAKRGVKIVNVARGGLVDEAVLVEALESGQVSAAALDVFENEPLVESPLLHFDQVVVTPHLGASTREAQIRAGIEVAEWVNYALAGEINKIPIAMLPSANSNIAPR